MVNYQAKHCSDYIIALYNLLGNKNIITKGEAYTVGKYRELSSKALKRMFRSCALSGKMLLVRIVENDKIDDYLGQVRLSKG